MQGDSSGQRGFSRRCLDIDASVARRKSLGSMGGRKPVGSRLKDCSGSIAGDGSNADCVVGDVVPATPDGPSGRVQARASGLANSNDSSRAESDSGTHTRGELSMSGAGTTKSRLSVVIVSCNVCLLQMAVSA